MLLEILKRACIQFVLHDFFLSSGLWWDERLHRWGTEFKDESVNFVAGILWLFCLHYLCARLGRIILKLAWGGSSIEIFSMITTFIGNWTLATSFMTVSTIHWFGHSALTINLRCSLTLISLHIMVGWLNSHVTNSPMIGSLFPSR